MESGEGRGNVHEFQPHPVKEQLLGVDYCIRTSPSWQITVRLCPWRIAQGSFACGVVDCALFFILF
ncbi:hypothetical protein TSUD_160780 [Trifolium subterraneum]|uniref:Uncharacterized protein n=1 Tax=Trifolium subterraneum TaxID=3900 RepID=A0A2Z6MJL2_TRISU|nr:hypothetical protein TSUD_160780 [Trifolium subterraneum]